MKNPEIKTADMQLGSEEAEVKLNVSIQKENIKEENGNNKEVEGSTTDKEDVDQTEQTSSKFPTSTKTIQEVVSVGSKIISQEKEEVSLQNVNIEIKELEEITDVKLTYDAEKYSTKNGEEKLNDKQPKDDSLGEELQSQDQLKNGINEKEEIQSETQTDTESYSVDIVESTTSELSETSESISQNDTQKEKEKINDVVNNEASVSYDSSMLKDSYMLKDVHVMLVRSDCMKDNSKLDASNIEGTPNQLSKDLSFGRTLRNISGRHSIGRSRHITLRDRISPNSSLFVNTSDMSIAQDEGTDSKALHYSSLLSDLYPRNGSPLDRKRKIETANWDSTKKQKTDDGSSSLNTSINLVKGFVKPLLISTPKSTPYKFESTKLDISGIKDDDNKVTTETTESTKKWCVIM
ncbi:uncharacterized protein [Anoplolepis gracilipes]